MTFLTTSAAGRAPTRSASVAARYNKSAAAHRGDAGGVLRRDRSTIHTRLNNVRAILRGAVSDRVIPTDPSIGVALPRRRRAEAAMTIPTTAEIGKVLNTTEGPFRAFVALCAFAGLRVGEGAGLQLGDIDFLRRTLTVSSQMQREVGGFEVRAPGASAQYSLRRPWCPC